MHFIILLISHVKRAKLYHKCEELYSKYVKVQVQKSLSGCRMFFSFFRLINPACKIFPLFVPFDFLTFAFLSRMTLRIIFLFLNKIKLNFPSTYEKLYSTLFSLLIFHQPYDQSLREQRHQRSALLNFLSCLIFLT